MKVYVVCVNGAPQSGKTSFETLCQSRVDNSLIYSSIAPIKALATVFGWDGYSKEDPDRRMLSNLKKTVDDWYRERNKTPFTVAKVYEAIRKYVIDCSCPLFYSNEDDERVVAFVDVREPRDLNYFKERFNATTVIVERDIRVPGESEDWGNRSDNGVYNYEYDVRILNYTTIEDLGRMADIFLDHLFKTDKYCKITGGEEEYNEFCD